MSNETRKWYPGNSQEELLITQEALEQGQESLPPKGTWKQLDLFSDSCGFDNCACSKEEETVLEEAQRLIVGDRNLSYDHPYDNFTRIAQVWTAILGIKITPEQVGLCMVGVKLAREAYQPKRDNLVDGAGYFGTIQMVRDERARRGA